MILFGALFAMFSDVSKKVFFLRDIYLWHSLVFATLFNVAVVYALVCFPDWMWMYFLPDSHNTVMELIYIFSFLYYLPCVLGFVMARELRQISLLLWLIFALVMIVAEAWLILHLYDRYSVVGTREQFLSQTAISLFDPKNPIGPVMNGSVIAMVLYYFAVVYFHLKKKKSLVA